MEFLPCIKNPDMLFSVDLVLRAATCDRPHVTLHLYVLIAMTTLDKEVLYIFSLFLLSYNHNILI